MEPRITLRQLTYFIEAARGRSLVRAADALGVSQPAVTKTIRELERNLDTQLFLRSRSGVELTLQGAAFLDRATTAMSELRAGVAHLDGLRDAETGQIRIGILPIAASRLLPMAVTRLKKKRPLVTVSVIPGDIESLLAALKLGEFEIVIGRRGEADAMVGLVHEVLFHDRLAIVVDRDHALAGQVDLALSDLAGEPWVVPNAGTAARQRLEELFREREISFPANLVEGIAGPFVRDYLHDAKAIGALPNNLVAHDISDGRLVRLMLDTSSTIGPTGITRREKLELQPSTRELIGELRRVARQLGGEA